MQYEKAEKLYGLAYQESGITEYSQHIIVNDDTGRWMNLRGRMSSFAENLKLLLQDKGVKAAQAAKALNISTATFNEYLHSGDRIPRDAAVIKRIAQYFQVSVHRLLYGEEDNQTILGSILERTEIHTGLYEITIKKVAEKK